jgi:xylulose-5-phosphate/fructose-6-phosphate phosphoketolase
MKTNTLTPDFLSKINAYWRAANYLSVGQIYLYDNPLLKRPLALTDVKHMLLGHWGTTPGQNFIYAHLNRAINKYDLDMIYVSGPGHGGPAVVANTYLEGTYSEIYDNISQDEAGLRKLFRGMSRLDSRGRRTGLLIESFLRGRVRQSQSDCCVRRRRRRSGNGASGHGLALE